MTGDATDPGEGAAEQGAETAAGADSAGKAWHGRDLSSTGFDDDTGEADPDLLDALRSPESEFALVEAVSRARLLVPVVAHPGEVDESGEHAVEQSTEMAAVTLNAPNGVRALPVFTGQDTLLAWADDARPVPVTATRAAQAAASEACDVIVIDIGTDHARQLRSSMMWALAQGREWRTSWEDPIVLGTVAAVLSGDEDVQEHEIVEGDPPGQGVLGLRLKLRPGLSREELQAAVERIGERLAVDEDLRTRVDGISFTIR